MSIRNSLKRPAVVALLLIFAVLWFGNLDYRKLVRPDEGRYAEIPREMVATGDWLTPRLNGIKYFEKPALQYWATAASYEIFGQHEWTARLWPALTGFAGVLLVYFLGAWLWGATAGLYAAAVSATSLLYMVIGHIATLDMSLTFFMTLSLAGMIIALSERAPPAQRVRWIYVTWIAMALAMLTKGLEAIVLPLFVLGLYSILHGDIWLIRKLRPWSGGLLFCIIALPWFIAVSIKNPGFAFYFFIVQHFERYLTDEARRLGPWWFFVPILLAGMLPWLLTSLDLIRPSTWRKRRGEAFHPERFLVIWTIGIFLFFSFSQSKLPSYILPIFPSIALLAGWRLTTMSTRNLRWNIAFFFLLGVLLLVLAPEVVRAGHTAWDIALYRKCVPWIRAAGAVVMVGAVFAYLWSARASRTPAVMALAFATLLAEQTLMTGYNVLSPKTSFYQMAQEIKPYMRPDMPFYSVGTYEQTLPFYLNRTVTLVAFEDEMAYGLRQQPQLEIKTYAKFEQIWREQKYAMALMPPGVYDKMARADLPMKVIARNERQVVVCTPPGPPPLAQPAPAGGRS